MVSTAAPTAPAGLMANARLELGPQGAALIRKWETLRTKAYLDTEGIPTIGYGTTSKSGIPVKMGMVITAKQAEEYMQVTVEKIYGAAVKKYVKVPLRQQEYDALCSFVYNVGPGGLAGSTLLRKLNKGQYDAVPSEMMRWVHSKSGNAGRGLRNRRTAEVALWESAHRLNSVVYAYDADDGKSVPDASLPENRPTTPSGDRPIAQSTTMQSLGAVFASMGYFVNENFNAILEWARSGRVVDYVFVAIAVCALLWVAYARLYREQEALVR